MGHIVSLVYMERHILLSKHNILDQEANWTFLSLMKRDRSCCLVRGPVCKLFVRFASCLSWVYQNVGITFSLLDEAKAI